MFKISLVLVLALICNGCASSTENRSMVPKVLKPTKNVDSRLIKHAFTEGCIMMKSGYMVCPKSMNR